MLVLQKDDDADETPLLPFSDEPKAESVELSVNSVVDLTLSRRMKVRGHMGAQEVIMLVDAGASHNFISTELVRKLDLPLTDTANYGVLMGTLASQRMGRGYAKGLSLLCPQ